MTRRAARRYSERAFPPYRHQPGETPHPERDPAGHMYGRTEPAPKTFDPDRWRENELYLYGVDLFNHGYWWEAHAEWERLWQATGRSDTAGSFLQGLIQVAAALVQHRAGRTEGARKLAIKGVAKLRRVDGRFMGVDVAAFADAVESSIESGTPPVIELARS
ncbi:MAG: DUF309 domain-containing protein [Vicinamibacteria bacterium]